MGARSAALIALLAVRAWPQSAVNFQTWSDFVPTKAFNDRWSLETEIGARGLLSHETWAELSITPTLEYSPRPWIDIDCGVKFSKVWQHDAPNTFELRPYAGAKLNLYWRRFKFVNYGRYEFRHLAYLGTTTPPDTDNRIRDRIGFLMRLNRESFRADRSWYLLADFEKFFNVDQGVREAFNFRDRSRAGIGYRHSARWTTELIFTFQRSRNTLDGVWNKDHILRFRLKWFL